MDSQYHYQLDNRKLIIISHHLKCHYCPILFRIPWLFPRYLSRIYLFHQKPQRNPRLYLVPDYEQCPLLFGRLSIGLWKRLGLFWICPHAWFCGFPGLFLEEGRRQHPGSLFSSFDWFPPWLLRFLFLPRGLPGPRCQGPLPETWRSLGNSDLFLLCTLKAGLYLCKYQAISEHSKKSKQK